MNSIIEHILSSKEYGKAIVNCIIYLVFLECYEVGAIL